MSPRRDGRSITAVAVRVPKSSSRTAELGNRIIRPHRAHALYKSSSGSIVGMLAAGEDFAESAAQNVAVGPRLGRDSVSCQRSDAMRVG
jgi:hypothetical protein